MAALAAKDSPIVTGATATASKFKGSATKSIVKSFAILKPCRKPPTLALSKDSFKYI